MGHRWWRIGPFVQCPLVCPFTCRMSSSTRPLPGERMSGLVSFLTDTVYCLAGADKSATSTLTSLGLQVELLTGSGRAC